MGCILATDDCHENEAVFTLADCENLEDEWMVSGVFFFFFFFFSWVVVARAGVK